MKRLIVCIFAILTPTLSYAGQNDFDFTESHDQMSALGIFAAGFANALNCDFLVNTDAAGKYLGKAFNGRSFSATEVAKIANILIGVQAVQNNLTGKPDEAACAELMKESYGPRGNLIKGFAN
jgi:hypothetical protein